MDRKFAIFDMDGTLVDSMEFWHNLGREYLVQRGVREGLEEVLEKTYTLTMAESAELFNREFGLGVSPERMREEMDNMMEWHYLNDVPLKGEILKYLEALKEKKVRMCVASATPLPLVEKCLSRLGIDKYFEFMLSCETIGIGKTQPDIYLMAAESFNAEPSDVAVFEDALYAVKTAKNADFYTVGIKDSSNVLSWDDIASVADEVIEDWTELL